MDPEFAWTSFYESIANGLRKYRSDRTELVEGVYKIESRTQKFINLVDKFEDGSEGRLKDIDPFTVMATFNRNLTSDNREKIATELANFLGVATDKGSLAKVFKEIDGNEKGGVPTLPSQNAWFFAWEKNGRQPSHIDALWNLFEMALQFADTGDVPRNSFAETFDGVIAQPRIGRANLTMGLFWIRPWDYLSLDSVNFKYIKNTLDMPIELNGPKRHCSGEDYLMLLDRLRDKFQKDNFSIKSFPDLSRVSWQSAEEPPSGTENGGKQNGADNPDDTEEVAELKSYSIENIINEGCFVTEKSLHNIFKRLEEKKNLILQGPPGTGKTWLAKRLAYSLVKQKKNIRRIQFHPNLSYEDFVRGYRPSASGNGGLELVDGLFLQMATQASENPDDRHVIIIEEINRGNPAQIFGEILTLLETDKRKPEEALELSYVREKGEKLHIPENLHVIGTMNIADRSLALVDLALRRRFAFVDLKPEFGKAWLEWGGSVGFDNKFLADIQKRIMDLNKEIEKDPRLGPQYQVGHSYFTPSRDQQIEDPKEWFRQIVETEIKPYLKECWFDEPDKVESSAQKLLSEF